MRVVGRARRTEAALPRELPERIVRAIRRLAACERAAIAAAWAILGDALDPDASLIVIAPETEPSPRLIAAAEEAATAFAAGRGAAYRSDPTFLVDMMDNTLLAAMTIGWRFTGDAINLGAAAGQAAAAIELAAGRFGGGAPAVAIVAARPAAGGAALALAPGDGGDRDELIAWLEGTAP